MRNKMKSNNKKNKEYYKDYYKKNKIKIKLREKQKRNGYNGENKKRIRENIVDLILRENVKTILTLESKNFYFSKMLPEKKIIVFEKDKKTFNKMERKKTKNVSLFYGNISNFENIGGVVDVIYLDFCGVYESCKEEIFMLKESIKKSKIFGVTFCLRIGKKIKEKIDIKEDYGDYQFSLIRKLQDLLGLNLKVLYGESYLDSTPMVTIFFKIPNHQNSQNKNTQDKNEI